MKPLLAPLLLLCLPFTTVLAAKAESSATLPMLKSSALAPHLTTRIQWTKFPQPEYSNDDLNNQNRSAIIRVYANEKGKVTKATVQESTGLSQLDEKLLKAVQAATVQPFMDDDVALPVIGYQAFNLKLSKNTAEVCDQAFSSKVWQAQQQGKKTDFSYRTQPQLELSADALKQHDRHIKFSFKVNKHGAVKSVKIRQGSGIYALDQQVKQAVAAAQVDVPRKFWIYKKSTLKDEIKLKADGCH